MPGINFKINRTNNKNFFDSLSNTKVLYEGRNWELSLTSNYKYYPITIFENNFFYILLEGFIYSRTNEDLKKLMFTYSKEIFSENFNKNNDNTFENEDGEFVLFIYNKSLDKIFIQNDMLGRLPIYYSLTKKEIILSRNISFIKENSEVLFDKYLLANYLFLGYPLKDETLFQNVKRLYPNSIIYIDLKSFLFQKIERGNGTNFEQKEKTQFSIESLADELVVSARNRDLKGYKNIISLSGGLDSRLVGAAMSKANLDFEATTLSDPWKVDARVGNSEVEIAKELADIWVIKHNTISSGPAQFKEVIDLKELKWGLNHFGLAYLLKYLESVKNNFNTKINFFTGDGGDKVIKYQLASNNLKTTDDVVEYIKKFHRRFSLEQISKLLDIKTKELYANLWELVNSYPERNANYKFVHFILNERSRNWLFEGEDRNRHFFWSNSPFFSYPFFKSSMSIDDTNKINNKLYIDLNRVLSSDVNNVLYANTSKNVNSFSTKIFYLLKNNFNKLPNDYRERIKKILKRDVSHTNSYNYLLNYVKEGNKKGLYSGFVNAKELNKLTNIEPDQLKMLFTITSIISSDDFSHFKNNADLRDFEFIFN